MLFTQVDKNVSGKVDFSCKPNLVWLTDLLDYQLAHHFHIVITTSPLCLHTDNSCVVSCPSVSLINVNGISQGHFKRISSNST